jgi:hypothetical protein
MGAASVTGVGTGSAERSGLKGPGNGRNMFVPQLCPHVVASGVVTTDSSGWADIYFPQGPLPKSKDHYVVFITPKYAQVNLVDGTRPVDWSTSKTNNSDGLFRYFSIWSERADDAYGADTFVYSVVTVGFGLDIVKDNPNTP